jgi:hypothetical protein
MKSENLVTVGDISRSLGWSQPKVRGALSGLTPDISAGNGRVVLYDITKVKQEIYNQNRDILDFLGYLSPAESYDVTVEVDA